MKNINKLSILLILLLGLTFTSCETTDLELINDPNQITVANGNLERYMVAIQIDFKSFVNAMGTNGARLVRVEQMGSVNYVNAFEPADTNYEWRLAYANMFSDMKNAEALAINQEATKHIAVMKVLKAYTLMTLVDYFGDVPLSEATDLENFPQPHADDDAAVYAAAQIMLDEAIALFNDETGYNVENDFYYGNNFDKWVKLANTLKMNSYVNTRLVDTEAMGKFNALASNPGNYISTSADDFVFTYDVVINDEIDSRHPGYQGDYGSSGASRYRSNWLMDEMLNDNDPRIRYYFYRQNECTPNSIGADGDYCEADTEPLFCSSQSSPSHFPGSMVFCAVDNGYWGRDHGFGGGIPPDTFKRTAGGVYPIAGRFDDDTFDSVGLEQGGAGAGITPIYLASWSHFMLAEMALVNGSSAAGNHLANAMLISIEKTMSFGSLDPDADSSFEPSSAEVSDYINSTVATFNAGTSEAKWNLLGVQHLVAHYGNGSDSYNYYRRTGYPSSLQYSIEPSPGNFVRSFFYPADEANTNPNVAQKPNVDTQVFWDIGASSPSFPYSN